jgi:hypothetical protein
VILLPLLLTLLSLPIFSLTPVYFLFWGLTYLAKQNTWPIMLVLAGIIYFSIESWAEHPTPSVRVAYNTTLPVEALRPRSELIGIVDFDANMQGASGDESIEVPYRNWAELINGMALGQYELFGRMFVAYPCSKLPSPVNQSIHSASINNREFNSNCQYAVVQHIRLGDPIGYVEICSFGHRDGVFCSIGAFHCSIGGPSSLSERFLCNSALLLGFIFPVRELLLQQFNLSLRGLRFTVGRQIGPNGSDRSNREQYQREYLDAVVETRLRFLIGVPLFLLGVWLVVHCDRTVNRNSGWRGWLLWLSAGLCIFCSFVLLLYRGSLGDLL